MRNQPMRMQLRKILREILVGKSCWKFLAGKSCRKFVVGNFLWENLVGQGGEKANLRKALIGGNLAFGIG